MDKDKGFACQIKQNKERNQLNKGIFAGNLRFISIFIRFKEKIRKKYGNIC